ncbi:lipoyl(octanoyl) transferase LipB [Vicingaceae bacterium]|nr:lipoyl(octanoyl) transferase LipB [Vicingaceae bacterium]
MRFVNMSFTIITLDPTNYLDALVFQENFFNAQLEKKDNGEKTSDTLIFLQHTPVYTLGKSGDINNLKIPIEETGAEFYQTKRGGDITFHGPGQLVVYPIFDTENYGIRVREYVTKLEQCVINCLADYGLKGERLEHASGVWLDADNEKGRKICAIGLKVSRGISMHGLAFNINTDLNYFDHIVPCGLDDKSVTSLEKELGKKMDFFEVQNKLIAQFQKQFKS